MIKTIKAFLLILISLWSSKTVTSQHLNDLSFGTDSTLEVITWNIENFPKNSQATLDSVQIIIEALDPDIIAFQEIDDTTSFIQMINNIPEFDYYIESGYYAGLAYAFKTSTIQIDDQYEIYTTAPYWNAFPRSPMVMEVSFMGGDYIIINNHFKCCGDGNLNTSNSADEEYRRLEASNLLKQYIDDYFQNDNVIVVGDLNDVLTDNSNHNVFQPFIDDPGNYKFADYNIAAGSSANWSFPNWPSHLDHILVTNELFNNLDYPASTVKTIRVDDYLSGGFNTYDFNISDHRPVGLRIAQDHNLNITEHTSGAPKLYAYPNPFTNQTILNFAPLTAPASIQILNLQGQVIYEEKLILNQTSMIWASENMSNGIYIARLIVNQEEIQTCQLVLTH